MRTSPQKAGLSQRQHNFWKYRDQILYWDYLHDDFRGFIINHQTKYFLEYIRMLPEGFVTILYELHIDRPHDTTSQNKGRRLTMWLPVAAMGSDRQQYTYVKREAAITVFELLMMGGVSPETC
jgi:hypothetical protein